MFTSWPGKLKIFEIYPPKPLKSMALGSRIPALREDYKTGRLCGRYFLATVGKLLAAEPPLSRHLPQIVTPTPVVRLLQLLSAVCSSQAVR